MAAVTVISDTVTSIDASIEDGRVLLAPEALAGAIGWTLEAEGLCRGDVCVPVRDRAALTVGDRIDLAGVADALQRPVVVDADHGYVAVALPAEERRRALTELTAPDFTLPDLDGTPHSLHQWRGRKRLLQAFSSW